MDPGELQLEHLPVVCEPPLEDLEVGRRERARQFADFVDLGPDDIDMPQRRGCHPPRTAAQSRGLNLLPPRADTAELRHVVGATRFRAGPETGGISAPKRLA